MLFEKMQLEEDEKVIVIIRKHWWIIFTKILAILIFACVPLALLLIFTGIQSVADPLVNIDSTQWFTIHIAQILFVYTIWLLLLWITLANFWTDYYLDLWAITTKRVILVDQRGFFRRFLSSFRLERLQDMNIEINGIIPTLLDFGTIEAQTAGGSNEKFTSPHMPHPRDIKALIVNAADELTFAQSARIDNIKKNQM
jgi:hypothetical protein